MNDDHRSADGSNAAADDSVESGRLATAAGQTRKTHFCKISERMVSGGAVKRFRGVTLTARRKMTEICADLPIKKNPVRPS